MDFIVIPFVNAIVFIYDLLGHNFGLAIIIFTVLVRLATQPFTKQQMDSTKKMQEMQSSKKWQDLQKKYKSDPQKLQQEQVKLYQEMGINPLGSCLPTLIQFPIIIGLYWAVTRALAASPTQLLTLINDLRLPDAAQLLPINNTFLWMDLSQPERLVLDFIPASLPVIGQGIPVLAVLVFITSYFQTKLMTPTGAGQNDQAAQMNKMMTIYMPLLMAWLSYAYSAGLALYFVASNLISIVQYGLMGKLNFSNLLPARTKK
ncbi:MAG: membrane protein insertase YidC [Chloroflexi bacterium]|nr:membrane protein insertase YidC [Chloroflexota bacterium]